MTLRTFISVHITKRLSSRKSLIRGVFNKQHPRVVALLYLLLEHRRPNEQAVTDTSSVSACYQQSIWYRCLSEVCNMSLNDTHCAPGVF
jgi:hypothetical protein